MAAPDPSKIQGGASVSSTDKLEDPASAKTDELKAQASAKAKELGEKAKEAAPESPGEGVAQAQRLARENPVPLAIAGAFLAGFLLGRLLSR